MSGAHHLITLSIMLTVALIPLADPVSAETPDQERPWEVLDRYSSTVFLAPGEMESLHFDPDLGKLVMDRTGTELSDTVLQAIEKVPRWTRTDLTRTFLEIGDSRATTYARLILDCSDERFLDELAFSISHTSFEVLERSSVYPRVFMDNVETLYENDLSIDYADIVDRANVSTIIYWINISGNRSSFELPSDIYYWYVVHPKITDEDPTYIDPSTGRASSNGKFWRDWLFNHADNGYPEDTSTSTVLYPKNATPPLLREVLSGVDTVWNGESYRAPAGYLNNGTGNRRPFDYKDHAIEKVSNWVEKTLPLNVKEEKNRIGSNPERSVQPVRISRNHYGNCGELQDLTVAAARAALIPARGVLNTGEDHVWSEFWERGWHQWDNYWSDGGSGIDNFGNYDADFQGSWGKELSTVYSWRGDGYVEMVTGNYSDTANFKATVVDPSGRPVDGARVLLATENHYDPEYLTISSWGHTDARGEVEFAIGDSRNFWSRSSSSLGNDPPDSSGSMQVTQVITNSQEGNDYTHRFRMPEIIDRPSAEKDPRGIREGEYMVHVEFDVRRSYLHGRNMFTENSFSYLLKDPGVLDLYLTDDENYEKCRSNSDFLAYEMNESSSYGELVSYLTADDHLIISNKGCLNTEKLISYNVTVYSLPTVLITSPGNGLRITHTEKAEFTGSAFSNFGLDTVRWRVDDGEWTEASDSSGDWSGFSFELDTSPLEVGEHSIEVKAITEESKQVTDTISIVVQDNIPPEISICSPSPDEIIVQGRAMEISGSCIDDYSIERLTLTLDDGPVQDITFSIADGNWTRTVDTLPLSVGEHDILVVAEDPAGHEMEQTVSFYLTESKKPEVSILSPENNSVFRSGDKVFLKGQARDNVQLRFLSCFGDGEEIGSISPPGRDGSWIHGIDTFTMTEGEHVIEVRAEDQEGNTNFSRITIILDGTPPELDIITPEPDMVYAPEGRLLVRASAWDAYELSDVRMVFDGSVISEGTLNLDDQWEMAIDLSPLNSGRYEYFVEATDIAGLRTRKEGTFHIDDEAPSIFTYNSDMEEFFIGDTVYLNGTVSDRWNIASLTISMDGEVWNLTEDIVNGFYSLAWDTSRLEPGNYTFEIKAADLVGNQEVIFVTLSGREMVVVNDTGEEDVQEMKQEKGLDVLLLVLLILPVLLLLIVLFITVLLVRRRKQVRPQPPQYPGTQGRQHQDL